MYEIKALRNMITHKNYAVIDWWDIDICKPDENFIAMMTSDSWEFPEAYRVLHKSRKKSNWIYFDCREYSCTMKELGPEERIPAIQLQFVQEIIRDFSTGDFDRERYEKSI